MSSSFYKELVEGYYNDNNQEKIASSFGDAMEQQLGSYSTDELESLAEEMGLSYEKIANESNAIGTQLDKKEEEDKADAKSQQLAASPNAGEASKDERNATGSEASVQAKTKAEVDATVNDNAKLNEEYITKSAAIDVAYEIASEKLASCGFGLADYIYSQIEDEDNAIFLASNAEKLASVSGKNVLKVADDLIGQIEHHSGH